MLRSLFGAKSADVPLTKLPPLHSFVDVIVAGRPLRSVTVEAVERQGHRHQRVSWTRRRERGHRLYGGHRPLPRTDEDRRRHRDHHAVRNPAQTHHHRRGYGRTETLERPARHARHGLVALCAGRCWDRRLHARDDSGHQPRRLFAHLRTGVEAGHEGRGANASQDGRCAPDAPWAK